GSPEGHARWLRVPPRMELSRGRSSGQGCWTRPPRRSVSSGPPGGGDSTGIVAPDRMSSGPPGAAPAGGQALAGDDTTARALRINGDLASSPSIAADAWAPRSRSAQPAGQRGQLVAQPCEVAHRAWRREVVAGAARQLHRDLAGLVAQRAPGGREVDP